MPQKILIADDEESIRATIRRVFAGYVVVSACDGADAVRVIAAERPSVVLLDLHMPVMGGLEVLSVFKGAEYSPPFIVLTGDEEMEMAARALEMGAASYITKPFDVDFIKRIVLAALGGPKAGEKNTDRPWSVKRNKD